MKVEINRWLRVCLRVIIPCRLQVSVAKIQQSLPEMKRDGNGVASSLWSELLYSDRSTMRMATVLPQSEFIPKLAKRLQEHPESVVADFEEIRRYRQLMLGES